MVLLQCFGCRSCCMLLRCTLPSIALHMYRTLRRRSDVATHTAAKTWRFSKAWMPNARKPAQTRFFQPRWGRLLIGNRPLLERCTFVTGDKWLLDSLQVT